MAQKVITVTVDGGNASKLRDGIEHSALKAVLDDGFYVREVHQLASGASDSKTGFV